MPLAISPEIPLIICSGIHPRLSIKIPLWTPRRLLAKTHFKILIQFLHKLLEVFLQGCNKTNCSDICARNIWRSAFSDSLRYFSHNAWTIISAHKSNWVKLHGPVFVGTLHLGLWPDGNRANKTCDILRVVVDALRSREFFPQTNEIICRINNRIKLIRESQGNRIDLRSFAR